MDQNDAFPSDALSLLQLRVARRADELARGSKVASPLNLHCWFAAESELVEGAGPGDELQVGCNRQPI
jgi:hypothetical protein